MVQRDEVDMDMRYRKALHDDADPLRSRRIPERLGQLLRDLKISA
jgi:hypothetical protein